MAYLDYLQYWKKPEYAKFILYELLLCFSVLILRYPHCLYILDQLQDEEYRKHFQANTAYDRKCIMDQQNLHWKYYLKLRNQGSLTKVLSSSYSFDIQSDFHRRKKWKKRPNYKHLALELRMSLRNDDSLKYSPPDRSAWEFVFPYFRQNSF